MRSFLLLTFIMISATCPARKIRSVQVTAKQVDAVNYGTEIELAFTYTIKRGKVRTFDFDDIEKYFTFQAIDGIIVKDRSTNSAYSIRFRVLKYPLSFNTPRPSLNILFDNNEGLVQHFNFNFSFDQRCPLTLDFRGTNGTDGGPGKDRGSPILFRNGKDGADGTDGGIGQDGSFLRIMTAIEKDSMGNNVLYLLVNDSTHHTRYWYKTTHAELGVLVNVSGGNGGNGGSGGSGSSGKDAEVTSKGTKNAGDGGNGGNGGSGGNGGNAGHVIVMEHPSAKGAGSQFQVVANGGFPGYGGIGGSAGAGGKGLENSSGGSNGSSGINGSNGNAGSAGTAIEIYQLEQ